jgi:DNA ligase (NAD+)
MADDKILRMQQLIRELNEASDAYYNGLGERMTDYEWDARFDELRQLEQQTGTTLPDSPTQSVGSDIAESPEPTCKEQVREGNTCDEPRGPEQSLF